MNGDTAGLEPADSSSAVDAAVGWDGTIEQAIERLTAAEAVLNWLAEYKAAREVVDAKNRLQSRQADETREGQRSGKAVHGQDPQDAEVSG